MYFNNCTTIDQAKNLFRDLCKQLHPDTSGYDSQSEFIAMFKSFKQFVPTQKTETDKDFNADKFYNLLKKFDVLHDIKVSFVGSFVWLEDILKGATYQQKETIKTITIEGYNNANFASAKKSWYFSPSDYVRKSRAQKSLNDIKNTFGCKSFNVNSRLQLS